MPWNTFHSPFVPPSIKEPTLKKIENRQFVDFIDLLPENQINSIDGSHTTDDPHFDVEKATGYVKQNRSESKGVTRVRAVSKIT